MMEQPKFFGDRYELGEVLGHGGMAEVRIGIDRRLGRTVAVKILRADLANDPTFQARFRREAQSAAALNHPAIVSVYDTGEHLADGVPVPYIVMEYVEGKTLRDVLREGRRILPERALEITADVLEALEYSHRAGIVHRDIKPGNVMLTPNGDVKVMDFGIARAVADASATMTQTAAVIGTAQYLSPEQARGETVDARSDIYSTGCLLYELLTGRPPFVGDSPVSVAYQHVREEPRPPSLLDPEVTREADAITLKALQKKQQDRYQTADEMRGDLVRALAGQRVAAPVAQMGPPNDATARFMPAGPPPPQYGDPAAWGQQPPEPEPERRRKLAWALVTIGGVFLLAVLGFVLWQVLGANTTLVPDVTDKTVAEARLEIQAAGFKFEVGDQVANEEYEKGVVFDQSPAGNAEAENGSTISVTVSTGEPKETIPDGLVGQQLDDVEAQLRAQGLQVDTVENKKSDEPENEVTKVEPGEGEKVSQGSTVQVTYSAGYVEVPDVRGETEDNATSELEDEGFDVDVEEADSDDEQGVVFDQDPDAGTRKAKGSTVTIYIPTAVEPPNLSVQAAADPSGVSAGGTSQLNITVTNEGASDAETSTVNIQLPDGVTAPTPPEGCSGGGSTLSCTLSTIGAGQPVSFSVPLNVDLVAAPGARDGTVSVETEEDSDTSNNSTTFRMQFFG